MKIVVVSQRVDVYPNRDERRDALDQQLNSFLGVAGFLPVPVPNSFHLQSTEESEGDNTLISWLTTLKPNALLLSGGNDIGSCRERDSTENELLDYAGRHGLPALGICRGMQMMGVWAGAGLKAVEGHVATSHDLAGEITGKVNSYHNQSLSSLPSEFRVLARSEDGELEAIAHNRLSWEGWMWHPERNESFDALDIRRLQSLFVG